MSASSSGGRLMIIVAMVSMSLCSMLCDFRKNTPRIVSAVLSIEASRRSVVVLRAICKTGEI
jgi:hypothetical protein